MAQWRNVYIRAKYISHMIFNNQHEGPSMKKLLHTTIAALLIPIGAHASSNGPGTIAPELGIQIHQALSDMFIRTPGFAKDSPCIEKIAEAKSFMVSTDKVFFYAKNYEANTARMGIQPSAKDSNFSTIFSSFAMAAVAAQAEGKTELLLSPDQALAICLIDPSSIGTTK